MKQIISGIIVVVAIVAGGLMGTMLKGGSAQAGHDSGHEQASSGHGESKDAHGGGHEKKSAKKKKSGGHGGGHGDDSSSSSDVIYYKFSREFIVPLMSDGRVTSLVILNINLEADSAISEQLFSMEPKLRDNIMATLIELSNDGVTLDEVTNVNSYETIRTVVLMNLEKVVTSGIRNVLILDMAKQDL